MDKSISNDRSVAVKLIIAGRQDIDQDYENVEVVNEKRPNNVPAFFNASLEDVDEESLYLFMAPFDDFYVPNAITTMVQKLTSHKVMSIAYSDIMIRHENLSRQWLPSFAPEVLQAQYIINQPFMITGKALSKKRNIFNPLLERLYLHEFLINAIQRALPIHIADALFTSHIGPRGLNLTNDAKVLKECLELPGT